jgi:hypothetical protein
VGHENNTALRTMTPLPTLLAALNDLAANLRASGKDGPSRHFAAVAEQLSRPLAPGELREIATEVSRSAKIVALADFTRDEERLFDMVCQEAKRVAVSP